MKPDVFEKAVNRVFGEQDSKLLKYLPIPMTEGKLFDSSVTQYGEMWTILDECDFKLVDDMWFTHTNLPHIKISVTWRKLTIIVDTTVISSQKIECTKQNLNNLIKAFNPDYEGHN